MKVNIEISRLTEGADEKYKENLVPLASEEEESDMSSERIKELALQKLQDQNLQGEKEGEPKMKRISMKIIVAAAVLCTLTATAFAAANGGLEYFKSIFGESAQYTADYIQNPMQTVEVGDYRVTVESVLSDGFTASVILAVEDMDGRAVFSDNEVIRAMMVKVAEDWAEPDSMIAYSATEMDQFSTKTKQYYEVVAASVAAGEAVAASQLVFDFGSAELTLDVDSYMPYLEVMHEPAGFEDENLSILSLQISPMGALLHGKELVQEGGLWAPRVFLILKDGTAEEVFSPMSFDSSSDGEASMGGGGMVVVSPGRPEPLVTSTQGIRNENNSIAMRAGFSRIIDLNQVKAVRINGEEFPVEMR